MNDDDDDDDDDDNDDDDIPIVCLVLNDVPSGILDASSYIYLECLNIHVYLTLCVFFVFFYYFT